MELDGYDLLRQVKNAFCQLETLTETHRRTLVIVEEKRAEISRMRLEIEELSRLSGQMECLERAHTYGLEIIDDKRAETEALKIENERLRAEFARYCPQNTTRPIAEIISDAEKMFFELRQSRWFKGPGEKTSSEILDDIEKLIAELKGAL